MKNETPLVSVLMTAYNRQDYIAEAIESVLCSSYKNFELIIVDDCSVDNTVAIAKKYELQDKRVTVYINEINLKDYPNRNRAASYAKGEYIMFVDSDDKIYPDSIHYCINKMLEHIEVNMGMICYGNDDLKNKVVKRYESVHSHFFKKQLLTVGPGGTVLKRSFFERIGKYPEIYGPANDMYFNIKSATETDIYMFGYEFLYYRIHDGQEQNNQFSYLYNNYNYFKNAIEQIDMHLTSKQLSYLSKKNKRRFLVNSFRYFRKEKKLTSLIKAYKLTNFNFIDFLKGVFN
jgi:glycosyltransferase involved in cell wall biosynthesis